MNTTTNTRGVSPCPECGGAGVYPKAAVVPPPPDVTCRKCQGSGRDYHVLSAQNTRGVSEAMVAELIAAGDFLAMNGTDGMVRRWEKAKAALSAPDVNADVRARFEAEFRGSYDLRRDACGTYIDEYTLHAWWGYRAAHADLSGQVRELVEAVREYEREHTNPAKDYVLQAMRREQMFAALTKFTQQEKW